MIKTTAINNTNNEAMMVTWDTGRRCNYDCSYCENSRHDNSSPHHSITEYLKTFEFIKKWTALYDQHRRQVTHTGINFTGGEPTLNPAFWDLADHIKKDSREFRLSLTTNGAWNNQYTDRIVKRFDGVTVSYHAEGHPNLKKQVLENISALNESHLWLQVNVMMHQEHWDECVEVYKSLKAKNISAKIRPIGDGNVERKGWFADVDGTQRKTSHEYSAEQQQWYYEQIGFDVQGAKKKIGTDLGRGCCGGRCLVGKINGEWQNINIIDTHFEDWNCMVDWFFLHIDQHTKLVYHHQTCQALPGKKRGAIGSLNDIAGMLNDLQIKLDNPAPIICPNKRCGCGMCIPKSKEKNEFAILWNSVVK